MLNEKYLGRQVYINTNGYKIIKISKKQLFVHRLIWETENGMVIPKGFVIHHRDKNPLNNDIDNLMCLPTYLHNKWHKNKQNHPSIGKKLTDEHKEKIRKSNIGKNKGKSPWNKGLNRKPKTMMKIARTRTKLLYTVIHIETEKIIGENEPRYYYKDYPFSESMRNFNKPGEFIGRYKNSATNGYKFIIKSKM